MAIIDFMKLIGKNHKKLDGEFGIEIETETKSAYDAPQFFYWTSHGDGSLRDYGIEYVLKQPVKYEKELDLALKEFKDKTEKIKFIKDSFSTSVHVHINVLNETFKTLGNLLTLYSLFENILIRYSGPDRLSNLFCLPMCDAEDIYKNIVNMFNNIQIRNYKNIAISEQSVKYSACNIATIYNLGSVEIRSFRGETDIEKIKSWVSILNCLLTYARKDISPKDVVLSWKDRQLNLLNDVFGGYAKELHHADELKLIDQNVWYAASIAYSVKDWDTLDKMEKAPEFKPTLKQLDQQAAAIFGGKYNQLSLADQQHILFVLQREHNRKYSVDVKQAVEQAAFPPPRPRGVRIPPPDIHAGQAVGEFLNAGNADGNGRQAFDWANIGAEGLNRGNPQRDLHEIARQLVRDQEVNVFDDVERDRDL